MHWSPIGCHLRLALVTMSSPTAKHHPWDACKWCAILNRLPTQTKSPISVNRVPLWTDFQPTQDHPSAYWCVWILCYSKQPTNPDKDHPCSNKCVWILYHSEQPPNPEQNNNMKTDHVKHDKSIGQFNIGQFNSNFRKKTTSKDHLPKSLFSSIITTQISHTGCFKFSWLQGHRWNWMHLSYESWNNISSDIFKLALNFIYYMWQLWCCPPSPFHTT